MRWGLPTQGPATPLKWLPKAPGPACLCSSGAAGRAPLTDENPDPERKGLIPSQPFSDPTGMPAFPALPLGEGPEQEMRHTPPSQVRGGTGHTKWNPKTMPGLQLQTAACSGPWRCHQPGVAQRGQQTAGSEARLPEGTGHQRVGAFCAQCPGALSPTGCREGRDGGGAGRWDGP